MVGNTGPGDGSGTTKIIRINSFGELLDGQVAVLTADVVVDQSTKTITVPATYEWTVASIFIKLITTATVGNRQMVIEYMDASSVVIMQSRAGIVQAASLTKYYQFGPSMPDLVAFRDTDYLSTPLPNGLVLPPTYKIKIYDKAAIAAAADDMTVQVMVKQRKIS